MYQPEQGVSCPCFGCFRLHQSVRCCMAAKGVCDVRKCCPVVYQGRLFLQHPMSSPDNPMLHQLARGKILDSEGCLHATILGAVAVGSHTVMITGCCLA